MENANRWEPVRKGMYYGSPGCCNATFCKLVDFDKAGIDAAELATRLGNGWSPRVWENLGWHWEVIDRSGHIRVRYTNVKCSGGWLTYYSAQIDHTEHIGKSDTPEGAIKLAMESFKAEAEGTAKYYADILAALKLNREGESK